ncbi:hypothetical protein GCM10025768_17430 [Microbacterium pseudoresistens]|uniref:Uncharacterized protein n=1 Tax=Microbacterium pseudoresistens TaxID=640634 RepID=A0A7Y9JNK8_9MICO|nr:hypothetical protein [Microbacterium pseudoresistens]NYD55435.1 hypothetical protein [Microbacterium pseudoresistens]
MFVVQTLVSAADELLASAVPWMASFEPILSPRLSRDDAVRGAIMTAVFGAAFVWLATAGVSGRGNDRVPRQVCAAAVSIGLVVGALLGTLYATTWAGAGLAIAVSLGLGLVAIRLIRQTRAGLVTLKATARRDAEVKARGRFVRGEIITLRFLRRWRSGSPEFQAKVRFLTSHGWRVVESRLVTEPHEAPVIGGTALVWHLDTNGMEHVVVEPDPHSRRDPEAILRYAP